MAGEPRAHEGRHVFAHPVDVAHDLTHDAAIVNEVSFRKHICPKALADLSGGLRSLFADRPPAGRSPRFRLALTLEMKIEGHRLADETLQRCFVDLLALVNIDGPPDVPAEAEVK